MSKTISRDDLRELFTKSYGADAPTRRKWSQFYNSDVIFIDPTQKTEGLDAYIKAQEKLIKRCDDVYLQATGKTLMDAELELAGKRDFKLESKKSMR